MPLLLSAVPPLVWALCWAVPGLVTIGVVTGTLRATGSLVLVVLLVTGLVVAGAVAQHAQCTVGRGCLQAGEVTQVLGLLLGTLIGSHVVTRLVRGIGGGTWRHWGAGPGATAR